MIDILLNGQIAGLPREMPVADAVKEFGYTQQHLAVALNRIFLPRDRWDTVVSPGDELEIVAPMQGG